MSTSSTASMSSTSSTKSSKSSGSRKSKKSIFNSPHCTNFIVRDVHMLRQAVLLQCAANHNTCLNAWNFLKSSIEKSFYESLKASIQVYIGRYLDDPYVCNEYMDRVLQEPQGYTFNGIVAEIVSENMDNNSKEFIQFLHIILPVLKSEANSRDINFCIRTINSN